MKKNIKKTLRKLKKKDSLDILADASLVAWRWDRKMEKEINFGKIFWIFEFFVTQEKLVHRNAVCTRCTFSQRLQITNEKYVQVSYG